jgi:hypothetical protein
LVGVAAEVGAAQPFLTLGCDAKNPAAEEHVVAVNPVATSGVGSYGRATVAVHAGGNMRGSSSRAATAAALVAGLAVLVVAGRLLPAIPSAHRPAPPISAGAPAGTVRVIPLREVPTSTVVGGVRVPNAIGRTLARATSLMRTAGLRGVAAEHDPQIGPAVVVSQEPPAGVLVPRGDVVGFRTRTDVQANGSPRRLRLPRGPTSWGYQLVAPDPARRRLTVVVAMPAAVELQVWLETVLGRRVPILDTSSGTAPCHPTGGWSRCVVRFGVLEGEDPGLWTATSAKQSSAPAAVQVTVTFAPR